MLRARCQKNIMKLGHLMFCFVVVVVVVVVVAAAVVVVVVFA